MKVFRCTIPEIKLVSVNKKFLTHPAYINNKEYIAGLMDIDNVKNLSFTTPTGLTIYIKTLKDIDNTIKMIQDALQFAGILEDDNLIFSLNVKLSRTGLSKGDKESVFVELVELPLDILDHIETEVTGVFNK